MMAAWILVAAMAVAVQADRADSVANGAASPRATRVIGRRCRWIVPVNSLGWHDCTCRGTGSTWACSEMALLHVPTFTDADATDIDLSRNLIARVGSHDLAGMTSVRSLKLCQNRIEAIEAGAFDDLVELTSLELWDNRIASLPANLFDPTTKLKSFHWQWRREQFDPLTGKTMAPPCHGPGDGYGISWDGYDPEFVQYVDSSSGSGLSSGLPANRDDHWVSGMPTHACTDATSGIMRCSLADGELGDGWQWPFGCDGCSRPEYVFEAPDQTGGYYRCVPQTPPPAASIAATATPAPTGVDEGQCHCIGPGPSELAIPPSCCSIVGQPACNADRVCTGAQVPGKQCFVTTVEFLTAHDSPSMDALPAALTTACRAWLEAGDSIRADIDLACASTMKGYLTRECAKEATATLATSAPASAPTPRAPTCPPHTSSPRWTTAYPRVHDPPNRPGSNDSGGGRKGTGPGGKGNKPGGKGNIPGRNSTPNPDNPNRPAGGGGAGGCGPGGAGGGMGMGKPGKGKKRRPGKQASVTNNSRLYTVTVVVAGIMLVLGLASAVHRTRYCRHRRWLQRRDREGGLPTVFSDGADRNDDVLLVLPPDCQPDEDGLGDRAEITETLFTETLLPAAPSGHANADDSGSEDDSNPGPLAPGTPSTNSGFESSLSQACLPQLLLQPLGSALG